MRGRDGTHEIQQGIEFITDLYNNYRGAAYQIIKDVLGDQIGLDAQDDLVQEGFCRMLGRLDTLLGRSRKAYYHYMRTTMLHLALDEGRRLSGKPCISFQDILESEELALFPLYGVYPDEHVISEADRAEANGLLYQAMEHLNQQEYDLIVGYYFFEIKDPKMAEWLGLKEAVVRVYRGRALKKLAKHYKHALEQERRKRQKSDSPKKS